MVERRMVKFIPMWIDVLLGSRNILVANHLTFEWGGEVWVISEKNILLNLQVKFCSIVKDFIAKKNLEWFKEKIAL